MLVGFWLAAAATPGLRRPARCAEQYQHERQFRVIHVGIYDGSYLAFSVLVAREMGYFDDDL